MFELSFRVFRLAYVNVEAGIRAELPLCLASCLGDCLQLSSACVLLVTVLGFSVGDILNYCFEDGVSLYSQFVVKLVARFCFFKDVELF